LKKGGKQSPKLGGEGKGDYITRETEVSKGGEGKRVFHLHNHFLTSGRKKKERMALALEEMSCNGRKKEGKQRK